MFGNLIKLLLLGIIIAVVAIFARDYVEQQKNLTSAPAEAPAPAAAPPAAPEPRDSTMAGEPSVAGADKGEAGEQEIPAESSAEAAAKPVTEAAAEPVTEAASEPASEPAGETVTTEPEPTAPMVREETEAPVAESDTPDPTAGWVTPADMAKAVDDTSTEITETTDAIDAAGTASHLDAADLPPESEQAIWELRPPNGTEPAPPTAGETGN